MNWEKTFGAQMRRRRKACGLSQVDLARVLADSGVPPRQTAISKIENGDRPLRLNEACAIAAALGTDLNSMIGVGSADPLIATTMTHLTRIAELEHAVAAAQRALSKVGGAS